MHGDDTPLQQARLIQFELNLVLRSEFTVDHLDAFTSNDYYTIGPSLAEVFDRLVTPVHYLVGRVKVAIGFERSSIWNPPDVECFEVN
jgi:hypothetical protein